ncbi:MAG: UDP-N-acetylmuramoyl-L-alanyl-D-glutamate--2,6-diaminopimelate ligase [Verrucomicrobia bacterium]|nr:UDP-N-acetylmuramoyl-L-alanyl-D-glutamate--2,6-diaminopimelate ligase [Verrucomicrobiota bacterium]
MKLKKLLKDIPEIAVRGSKEIEITGISANSKAIGPGNLFIAKKGLTHDGSRFIPDAVAAGASAVLTDIYNPFYPQLVQLVHPRVDLMEAKLARAYFNDADRSLFLVGITGTNGKTTTSYLIKFLLDHLKNPCGLIGTIEWIVGQHVFPSSQTTPDVITNYKLFQDMAASNCTSCVMEVSSHALHQGRVNGIEYDVAVFTNLTQDHLDYHPDMDSYADAKATLFSSLVPAKNSRKPHFSKTAIVNADSSWHPRMLKDCKAQVIAYGIDAPCDLKAEGIRLSSNGMRMEICYQSKLYPFESPLIGRFNVYNCLAAIGVGLARGFQMEEILKVLSKFPKVPGRLERVPNPKHLPIFVDYAHTDDALSNVLQTLNEIKTGRLITVFGCGGSRDQGKRPKMGAVVESLSDVAIVTSDNPRQEDPDAIIRQILTGFKSPAHAIVIADRAEAIKAAVDIAKPNDLILIAGKGHETYQIFSHQTINFDDRLVAQQACNSRSLA